MIDWHKVATLEAVLLFSTVICCGFLQTVNRKSFA